MGRRLAAYPIVIDDSHSVQISFLRQSFDGIEEGIASFDGMERIPAGQRRPHHVLHCDLTESFFLKK